MVARNSKVQVEVEANPFAAFISTDRVDGGQGQRGRKADPMLGNLLTALVQSGGRSIVGTTPTVQTNGQGAGKVNGAVLMVNGEPITITRAKVASWAKANGYALDSFGIGDNGVNVSLSQL